MKGKGIPTHLKSILATLQQHSTRGAALNAEGLGFKRVDLKIAKTIRKCLLTEGSKFSYIPNWNFSPLEPHARHKSGRTADT